MGKKKEQEITNLEDARKAIAKEYGDGAVKRYKKAVKVPTISTGIITLDKGLGGGVPRGRMVEFLGEQSSGKTSLALSIAVEGQKADPKSYCAYIDAEHALDTQWAAKLGIDFSRFEHCEPEFGEDALNMLEIYIQTGMCSTIILDSVAAILPKAEVANDLGSANIGSQARLVSQALRRINRWLNKHPDTIVIWINQKRAKIGGGPGGSFNYEPTKATGGKALPFYCTTRMSVARTENLKVQEEIVGQTVKVNVLKNKVNNGPGALVYFYIDNRYGLDKAKEVLNLGIADGTIDKAGAWYKFSDEHKFQGEEKAKEYLREHIDEWLDKYKEDG